MSYSCIPRTFACRSICWQQTQHRGARELPQCEIRLEEHKDALKLPCASSGRPRSLGWQHFIPAIMSQNLILAKGGVSQLKKNHPCSVISIPISMFLCYSTVNFTGKFVRAVCWFFLASAHRALTLIRCWDVDFSWSRVFHQISWTWGLSLLPMCVFLDSNTTEKL